MSSRLAGYAIIESVTMQNETPLFFRKGNRGGKIVPVLFEGILRVSDPDGFWKLIYEKYEEKNEKGMGRYIAGLGHAKSFGCGLMLLRPA